MLLQQWFKRNGWSLAVVSRLAELSLLSTSERPVRDWAAGMPLQPGDWVNHRGHVWEAPGTLLTEPAEASGWIDHGLTSRLHASGLNLYLRNRKATLTVTFLCEMGRLNEWVAQVQLGQAIAPADARLNELVAGATVIKDSDGPLGPEELLAIVAMRLEPPLWPDQPATTRAKEGLVSARQLRAAAAASGLDIVEDWAKLASLYPSEDPDRLARLQQVLTGLAYWDDEQAENEHAACVVLLERLRDLAGQRSEAPADAST
jgi:hypothetical protein